MILRNKYNKSNKRQIINSKTLNSKEKIKFYKDNK